MFGVSRRSNTKRAVKPHRDVKFPIKKVEGLYYAAKTKTLISCMAIAQMILHLFFFLLFAYVYQNTIFTSITRKTRGAFKHDLERADVSMWSYVDTETPLKDDHLPESNPDSSSNKCLFYCCTCATLPT